MALITCPECGKQISDKAELCIGCGFPISDYKAEIEKQELNELIASIPEPEYLPETISVCMMCGNIENGYVNSCPKCHSNNTMKHKANKNAKEKNKALKKEYESKIKELKLQSKTTFNGIYKIINGEKTEVYCPKCGSSNCEWVEHKNTNLVMTKNLNPLRPYAHTNIKERTPVTRPKYYSMILCKDCGNRFA